MANIFLKALEGDREAQLATIVQSLALHMVSVLSFVSLENTEELRQKTRELADAALSYLEAPVEVKEPPLLQCIDCKNTESPAGAMTRYFNHGRCLHCGGFFKVVRA